MSAGRPRYQVTKHVGTCGAIIIELPESTMLSGVDSCDVHGFYTALTEWVGALPHADTVARGAHVDVPQAPAPAGNPDDA